LYYLLSLGGEQLARARLIPAPLAVWIANVITLAIAYYFLVKNNASHAMLSLPRLWGRRAKQKKLNARAEIAPFAARPVVSQRWSFLTLLDRNLLNSLVFYFCVAFLGFVALFMIFTVFELWKFVIKTGVGASVVARYLFFLLPLTAVSLASTSTLVGVLATYALISRRSEALAWWASGQSAYRLAVPGIFFALWIGVGLWAVQERMMPVANQKQDALRAQIRNGIARTSAPLGRQWLASADGRRIYHFEFDEARSLLLAPVIYEFDAEGVHIVRIIEGETGRWDEARPDRLILGGGSEFLLDGGGKATAGGDLALAGVESIEVFKPGLNKPSQMSSGQLSDYIKLLNARGMVAADLTVALARKQVEPYSPVVMALIGIPLALAFGRRSAVAALASAILIGLSFWGVSGGFQQLGAYGLLPARAAAWSPAIIFSTLGIYLLTRIRT
jgi:LPS export ABC transporter permease LptG